MRDLSRLRRSTSDRYFAGVAGGLGRHLDIDPTIIRVLLAVLTFFGGAGLLVYGAFWLFVPEDGRDRAPIELGSEMRRVVLIVAAVLAASLVFGAPFFGNGGGLSFPLFPFLVIGLIGLVIYAARGQRTQAPDRNQPPPPWGSTSAPPTTPEGSTMSATDTLVDPVTSRATRQATNRATSRRPGCPRRDRPSSRRHRGPAAPGWCCSGRPSR